VPGIKLTASEVPANNSFIEVQAGT
jgi:hypothetical protein